MNRIVLSPSGFDVRAGLPAPSDRLFPRLYLHVEHGGARSTRSTRRAIFFRRFLAAPRAATGPTHGAASSVLRPTPAAGASVVDRLVRRGPEVEADGGRAGGGP